jgi:predicted dehydrogenase
MEGGATSVIARIRKLLRFTLIYGPRRTLVKALGRLRVGVRGQSLFARHRTSVAIIGCGQFAFSTIAYFLRSNARVVGVFDTDANAANSFARFFSVPRIYAGPAAVLSDPEVGCIYISSNHASHASYAAAALAAGKNVYVEKPVAVSHAQLADLIGALSSSDRSLFAGYNRPFSSAIRDFRSAIKDPFGPLTMSCFVSGHVISADHWYRNPKEGTRVCGNVGHWLDLAIHVVSWRTLPDRWRIMLCWSDDAARDDNIAISLASNEGDLINIVLSARTEPFEGINETINFQWGEVIAKIDDFRRQTIWKGTQVSRKRYWPKDVGHRRAVLQPFAGASRQWSEIEASTLLMLRIMEMVRGGNRFHEFSFEQERLNIGNQEESHIPCAPELVHETTPAKPQDRHD